MSGRCLSCTLGCAQAATSCAQKGIVREGINPTKGAFKKTLTGVVANVAKNNILKQVTPSPIGGRYISVGGCERESYFEAVLSGVGHSCCKESSQLLVACDKMQCLLVNVKQPGYFCVIRIAGLHQAQQFPKDARKSGLAN